jgi:hypothetical protein
MAQREFTDSTAKCFIRQLSFPVAASLDRIWIEGIVVALENLDSDPRITIDDGTGLLTVRCIAVLRPLLVNVHIGTYLSLVVLCPQHLAVKLCIETSSNRTAAFALEVIHRWTLPWTSSTQSQSPSASTS